MANKIPKFNYSSVTTKQKIIAAGIIVLLALGVYFAWLNSGSSPAKNKEKQIVQKLDNLNNKQEISCEEVVSEVGGASADSLSKTDRKIDLLNKQMFCFSDTGQFDKAIESAQKLQAEYESQGNKELADQTAGYIKQANEVKKRQTGDEN